MQILLFLCLLCTGVYFEYQSCVLAVILLILLCIKIKQKGNLILRKNYMLLFFSVICGFYLLSPLWAVDSHMAILGFLKFLPLPIYSVLLIQMTEEERDEILRSLPGIAASLVVISIVCSRISLFRNYFITDGRLAGTFEYPNTFALFLLIALLYLMYHWKNNPGNVIQTVIIIGGILMTGSRTIYVLLPIALIISLILLKEWKMRIIVVLFLVVMVLITVVSLSLADGSPLERITEISLSESTLLGRVLYWKDALPVILKHPLGLGYMGYYFMQGSFQTGVYSVVHAHNEFIQMFLDIGWIPGAGLIGLFAYGILKADCRWKSILIIVIGLHCLMDFDLQYIAIYMIFMLLLPWQQGESLELNRTRLIYIFAGCMTVILIYFGIGNGLYYYGSSSSAQVFILKIHFHSLKS